jgi:hypothetical protein
VSPPITVLLGSAYVVVVGSLVRIIPNNEWCILQAINCVKMAIPAAVNGVIRREAKVTAANASLTAMIRSRGVT